MPQLPTSVTMQIISFCKQVRMKQPRRCTNTLDICPGYLLLLICFAKMKTEIEPKVFDCVCDDCAMQGLR